MKMEEPNKERKAALHGLVVSAGRIHPDPMRLEFQSIRYLIKFIGVTFFFIEARMQSVRALPRLY